MNVETELRKYIAKRCLHGNSQEISEVCSLFQSGILDSLGVLQMISFMEERFKIRVEDEDMIPENFETIQKLVEFVESKVSSVNANARLKRPD